MQIKSSYMKVKKLMLILSILTSCVNKNYTKIENLEKITLPIEVGNAKIIGLGEATHGTIEFAITKSSIIKDLIKNHEFNLLAIEAHNSDVKEINRWLNGGEGDIEILIKGLKYWAFNNYPFLELLNWIKEHNSKSQNPVTIYGIDMQFVQKTIHEPFEYVKNYLPSDSNTFYQLQELDTLALDQLGKKFSNTSLDEFQRIKKSINLALQIVDEHLREDKISDSLAYWHQFDLNNSMNAINMYENDVYYLENSNYINIRDFSMANNLGSIIRKSPESKIIIWSHNFQIKNKGDVMGGHLKEQFGEKYINFCLTTRKGYVTAYDLNDSKENLSNFSLNMNNENTLEQEITKSELPKQFLMDTRKLIDLLKLKDSIFMLDIGAVYDQEVKENNLVITFLNKEYDYIIYLDSTKGYLEQ
ncbi:MAG: erythromycin esterase family protein [Algoriphagus sp.]